MTKITVVLSIVFIFTIMIEIQTISQYSLYRRSSQQTILQQYKSQDGSCWLFLIQSNGVNYVKRKCYDKIRKSIITSQLALNTGDKVELKAFSPKNFTYLIIKGITEDWLDVYRIKYTNANGYDTQYTYFYSIDYQFIPTNQNLKILKLSDYGAYVRLNQKIIYFGFYYRWNEGWYNSGQIKSIDDGFICVLTGSIITILDPIFFIVDGLKLSSQFKCTIHIHRTYIQESKTSTRTIVDYVQKFMMFCYKQKNNQTSPNNQTSSNNQSSPVYEWFVRGYLGSKVYQKAVQVDEINGLSTQIPTFKISPKLQKFLVLGKALNGSQFVIIKSVNYNDLAFQDIKISSPISLSNAVIQLNDYHVYLRSKTEKNSKYEFQVYAIINKQSLLIKKSSLSSKDIVNLVSTSIVYQVTKEPSLKGEEIYYTEEILQRKLPPLQTSAPILLHSYKNETDYFYTQQQISSLKGVQIAQHSKTNDFQFLYSKNSNGLDIKYFRDVDEARRVYAYQPDKNINKTLIVLESYYLNKSVNIPIDGIFTVISFSKGKQNCILAKDASNTLVSIVFKQQQQKLQILQRYQYDIQQLDLRGEYFSYRVSAKCEVFVQAFVDDVIYQLYRKSQDPKVSPIYFEDNFVNSQDRQKIWIQAKPATNQNYDYFLIYYYYNYPKYPSFFFERNPSNNQYKQIKTLETSIYKIGKEFMVDETNTKLIYPTPYIWQEQMKAIFSVKVDDEWKLIENPFTIKTLPYNEFDLTHKYSISPNLQIIIYQFINAVNSDVLVKRTEMKCLILHVNYDLGEITDITGQYKILTQACSSSWMYFKVINNYLYIRNTTNQFLLKLSDKGQGFNSVVMQNKIGIEYQAYIQKQFITINQNIDGKQQISLVYYTDYGVLYSKDTINVRTLKNDLFSQLNDIRGITYDYKMDKLYSCVPGCQYCFNRNLCRKCSDGYYMIFETKLCLRCQKNCKSCTFQNPSTCLSCFSGYVLVGAVCQKCHVSCFQCQKTTQNKCTSCDIGNTLIQISKLNTICLQCPQNCIHCSQKSKCDQCDTGFTTDENGKCLRCPLSCNKCNSSELSICLQCKMGFYVQKPDNNFENIRCIRCSDNCKICNSSTNCFQCIQQYKLKNYKSQISNVSQCVVKCSFPCKLCTQTNSTKCISCVQGYLYNQRQQTCEFDLRCNKFENCTVCPYEFNLINNICYSCFTIENCDSCYKFNFSQCLTCKKGYYMLQNECFLCGNECQQCILQNICTKCKPGYVRLDNLQASRCVKCSSNCKTCLLTPANCLTCNQNMSLQGQRCISNARVNFNMTLDYSFQQFTNKDYKGISSQIASKTGKSHEQVIITSIKKDVRFLIVYGYVIINNQQDQLSTSNNFNISFAQGQVINRIKIVKSQNIGTLTICKLGFYAQKQKCIKCQQQCSACKSQAICTKCSFGYFLRGQKCIPCSKDCKTCDYSPQYCVSCNEKLTFYNARCISPLSIIFNITIKFDYNAFSYVENEGILKNLALKIGKSRQNITMTQTMKGSVRIVGVILVDQKEDQTKTLETLKSNFVQGSNIDGKEITSSSYTGVIAQPIDNSSNVNVKLIIFIVIPSSVGILFLINQVICIVIFIAIFRVRKLHKKRRIQQEMKQRSSQSDASQKQRQKRKDLRAARRKIRNLPQTQKKTSSSTISHVVDKSEDRIIAI